MIIFRFFFEVCTKFVFKFYLVFSSIVLLLLFFSVSSLFIVVTVGLLTISLLINLLSSPVITPAIIDANTLIHLSVIAWRNDKNYITMYRNVVIPPIIA